MDKIFNYKTQKPIRQKLRKIMPKGEVILWNRLKDNKIVVVLNKKQTALLFVATTGRAMCRSEAEAPRVTTH